MDAPAALFLIRPYRESDADAVGRLIADTFARFNLAFASADQLALLLGPFRHAGSPDPAQRAAIAEMIRSPIVLVAEDEDEVVGILRGRSERLASLFVRGDHHRRGIGRRLVTAFEEDRPLSGDAVIRLASTLYAVPFYPALGYRRTTGVRVGRSFDGTGLPYQPMRKRLYDVPVRGR
ncbi:MAG: GNAT family N-acetyltransferase [Actinomycetes bacterium]|nr:GNAT family N-acetyltransferase [Actinomycetes bacterium]MDX5381089.1 GNAT family N-acetyltransferase [Actinomycetes bacterium]MDX5400294.1 GNAT family N-acetyltransferase [Actinomycetes bacterium]MDX5450843.1 GNAT family N-acetyltransferase [Actinomycetes bacterium]